MFVQYWKAVPIIGKKIGVLGSLGECNKRAKYLKSFESLWVVTNLYKLFKRATRLSKLWNTWKAFESLKEYLTFVRLLRVKASKACEGLWRWCGLYACVVCVRVSRRRVRGRRWPWGVGYIYTKSNTFWKLFKLSSLHILRLTCKALKYIYWDLYNTYLHPRRLLL